MSFTPYRLFAMKLAPIFSVSLAMLLAACAHPPSTGNATSPAPSLADVAAAQWQAPLAHNGQLADMHQWWQRQGDSLLVALIDAAQAASPSLATAASRIEQSRANLLSSRAAGAPTLDASASASRAQVAAFPTTPPSNTLQLGLLAGWEIDLFGTNRAASSAALERLASAQALWHEARVSVAAETASQYIQYRACTTQLALTQQDAASKSETTRLLGISSKAGFTASGQMEMARATAADAANQALVVAAQCEVMVKALVALTGLPERDLKARLMAAPAGGSPEIPVYVASIPAEALSQRPDLHAASRDIAAASQDLASTEAQRYPRLSLSGSIGAISVNTGGGGSELTTWSIGPLALSIPLIDGGRRAANTLAAKARYDEAVALYRSKVRQAVREVEEALVNLQATADRSAPSDAATKAWRASLEAAIVRQQSGFASQLEVEDSRRMALAAEVGRLGLQRDRLLAWVNLYRAVGGGWSLEQDAIAAAKADSPPNKATKPP